eukprot:1616704-Rhodomonas_salina.2
MDDVSRHRLAAAEGCAPRVAASHQLLFHSLCVLGLLLFALLFSRSQKRFNVALGACQRHTAKLSAPRSAERKRGTIAPVVCNRARLEEGRGED